MTIYRFIFFIVVVSVSLASLPSLAQPLTPEGKKEIVEKIEAKEEKEREEKQQEEKVRLHDDTQSLRDTVVETKVTREEAEELETQGKAEIVEKPVIEEPLAPTEPETPDLLKNILSPLKPDTPIPVVPTPIPPEEVKAEKETVVVKKPVTFWFGAEVQYEASFYEGIMNVEHDGGRASEGFFRRAEVDLRTQLFDWGETKLTYEAADEEFKDLYLRYIGKRIASASRITVGNQKEPFSMDLLSSSKFSQSMERSIATAAFTTGRSLGVQGQGQSHSLRPKQEGDFSWALGVFTEGLDNDTELDWSFSGRASRGWSMTENGILHTGISLSVRKGEFTEISVRPEVYSADILSLATFDAEDVLVTGLEVAYINGPFHIKSELVHADYEGGSEDAEGWGSYLQAGTFLTGELVRYSSMFGVFGQTLPKNDIAVEAFARISYLDAEADSAGNRMMTFTVGSNFYIQHNMKVAVNYVFADLDREIKNEDRGNALSMRFQYLY